jgi:hypothetical protein
MKKSITAFLLTSPFSIIDAQKRIMLQKKWAEVGIISTVM